MSSLRKIIHYCPWFWLFFLILTFLIFGKILSNFFVSDDWHWLWLAKNTAWSWQILFSNYEGTHLGGSYSPFLIVVYKLVWPLFGLHYFYYHLVSLLVHATNAWLVFLLTNKILAVLAVKNKKKLSLAAGILFLLWPTQVEAVAWLAAWPHLWATFFYLLALLFYFKLKENRQLKFLFLSGCFFILALTTKEIAISLPLVIFIWEAYFYSRPEPNSGQVKPGWRNLVFYFLILLIFFCWRYRFLGLLFGYYGVSQLPWQGWEWSGQLGALLSDFFTASYLRVFYYKVWYHYLHPLVILTFTLLAAYFYYLAKRKFYLLAAISFSFFLVLAPVLPLGLHRTTMEGERYLYLSSIFFVLWLIFVFAKLKIHRQLKSFLFLLVIIASLVVINQKIIRWQQASSLARQIVDSFSVLDLPNNQGLVSVALPDNLAGAQVFRNNLQQALELNYPGKIIDIIPLPVYLHFDSLERAWQQNLRWHKDNLGWLAESTDGSYVVTGQTSVTYHDFYFELWHYNYQNYTANIIRLMPDETMKKKLASGEVKILTFDQGKLMLLE